MWTEVQAQMFWEEFPSNECIECYEPDLEVGPPATFDYRKLLKSRKPYSRKIQTDTSGFFPHYFYFYSFVLIEFQLGLFRTKRA